MNLKYKRQIFKALCCLLASALGLMANVRVANATLSSEFLLAEQAVTRVMGAARNLVASKPYRFDTGVCFGLAVLKRGDFIRSTHPLEKGVEYLIFAAGDKTVQNIDLEVSNSVGKLLSRDMAPTNKPSVISYVPQSTGNYNLLMRLRKSRNASGMCALVVMRRTGGYALPLSVLNEAAKPEEGMTAELKSLDNLLRFHHAHNAWAMYGTVLKQDGTARIPNVKFETAPHLIFAGSGDERATDIDLYLSNGAGQRIAESTKQGATAMLNGQTQGDQNYSMTVANRKSKGASMIVVFAFDVMNAQPTTNSGAAVRPVNVSIDGKMLPGAVEVNGAVMVPLRGVFEAMGAHVQYNAANRTILATVGQDQLLMQVGVAQAATQWPHFFAPSSTGDCMRVACWCRCASSPKVAAPSCVGTVPRAPLSSKAPMVIMPTAWATI